MLQARTLLAVFGVMAGLVGIGADLLPTDRLVIRDFKYRDERSRFLVTGARALVNKGSLFVEQGCAELKPEGHQEALVLTTPRFEFDRTARRGTSTAPIQARRGELTLEGRGFTVDFNRKRLTIHHDVRVTFRGAPGNSLGKP